MIRLPEIRATSSSIPGRSQRQRIWLPRTGGREKTVRRGELLPFSFAAGQADLDSYSRGRNRREAKGRVIGGGRIMESYDRTHWEELIGTIIDLIGIDGFVRNGRLRRRREGIPASRRAHWRAGAPSGVRGTDCPHHGGASQCRLRLSRSPAAMSGSSGARMT